MRHSNRSTRVMALALIALVLGAAGCTAGDGEQPDGAADEVPQTGGSSEDASQETLDVLNDALAGPEGKDERVFGTSDDVVLQVIESTFSKANAKAEWSGETLRVRMDGSVEDPTSQTPCLALEALLVDGEAVVIDYDDGELICADRYDFD